MMEPSPPSVTANITVVVPTFGREQVLIETIHSVLALDPAPNELLVLDQTPRHEAATELALADWDKCGAIRWIRLEQPSIIRAMNQGMVLASSPLVLFVDDDIIPDPGLIAGHLASYEADEVWAVVGQVLQPREQVIRAHRVPDRGPLWRDLSFPFNSDLPCPIYNAIGCNLSVRRDRILSAGGFDDRFAEAYFRFETEFARRVWNRGGQVLFNPAASIRHLQSPRGGTRSYGSHLESVRPAHSVGDYYYALSHGLSVDTVYYCLRRLIRSVTTRYHLKHPWRIAPTLWGELRGLAGGARLAVSGPKLFYGPAIASQAAGAPVREAEALREMPP